MIISIIKLLILVAILLYASINDIKYREVPDWVSVMLLILGFVKNWIEQREKMKERYTDQETAEEASPQVTFTSEVKLK